MKKAKPKRRPAKPPARKAAKGKMPPAGSLPREVTAALRRVSGSIVRAKVLEGIIFMVLYAAFMLLLRCFLDRWLDFPRTMRILLLALDAGVVGWLFLTYLIGPLRRRPDREAAALRIEKAQPEFKSSLITCLQFCTSNSRQEFPDIWLQRISTMVLHRIKQCDLKSIVPMRHLRNPAIAAAILIVVLAASAFLAGPVAGLLLARYAGASVQLPTETRVVSVTEDLTVSIGSDAVLEARAEGVVPQSGRVEVRFAGGEVREFPVSAAPGSAGLFRLTLQNIQSDLTYRFLLGKGTGASHQVLCEVGPVIEEIICRVEPPQYTGLAVSEGPPGGISVPEGSKITIRLRASVPLSEAILTPEAEQMGPLVMTLDPADPKQAAVTFSATDLSLKGLTLPMRGIDGARSLQDAFYRINVVADAAPAIRLVSPVEFPESVTPDVTFDLVFEASDAYGLASVHLCYTLADAAAAAEPDAEGSSAVFRTALEIPKPGVPAGVRWTPSLDVNPPKPGQTVTFWIEASDGNTVSGPGIGRTDVHSFRVVTPAEKLEEIQKRFEMMSGQVERLKEQQDRAADEVGRVLGIEGGTDQP